MLCLSGFELYSRWVPLENSSMPLIHLAGPEKYRGYQLSWFIFYKNRKVSYLKNSATSFYHNAYKNSLNSDAIFFRSILHSGDYIEISFEVSLRLRTPIREVIPG